ncbi:hypothetical protein BX616_008547 [Lobosporangium transversale]|uniref:Flavin-containing amine oxidoreductase-domain containing protein n=1 Tax=Lobosporangium transversale TaxID=64571 RepID=A0A1Y2G9F4_9FUNG|nr:flavin-containing amine oxidoreductase-domain containing protein [Lobosporangium transversale]KAF9914311.1 hypothetical protein BX616_008547 [Lobosporangium transversale]ORZ04799.1 flavin-containing amine oxidoreductase-domain containing protein [Lobosporangium transversale]|eukprot:XP_021876736.1 flavin-containing amine oxidoreductase-domain containing protein [Lobosporangium transversale]
MNSESHPKTEDQRTRRKTILRHLSTSLGPAWIRSTASLTSNGPSDTGTRSSHQHNIILGKRIRKAVERFNPSSFPPTRSTTNTRSGIQRKRRTMTNSSIHSSISSRSRSQLSDRTSQERTHQQELNNAAHASRLHAHALSAEEFELFQYHLDRSDLANYLKVRNTMLWLWRLSPKEPLTLNKAFEATKDFGLHHGLIAHIYEFLLRSGYINFGACAFQDEGNSVNTSNGTADLEHLATSDGVNTGGHSSTNDIANCEDPSHSIYDQPLLPSENRKTVVVIGSGMAGVAVARQLENLFKYYAWRFAPELPPKVVVLEARSRIGGRMHSMELGTKASSTTTTKLSPSSSSSSLSSLSSLSSSSSLSSIAPRIGPTKHAVDLGAQIITGFENGNPMDIIVRKQLSDLTLHYLVNETCDLFDHRGEVVSKEMDVQCETVFNQILDKACKLRKSSRLPERLVEYLRARRRKDGKGPGRVQSTSSPTLGHSMDFFMETHPDFHSWTNKELELIHWHYANLEFANAAPLDQLSLQHWDQDDDYEFSGPHSMVVQGYGQVPIALSQGLDVRLDMPVSSVKRQAIPVSTLSRSVSKRHHREAIRVQCRDGSSFECTAAVITVPLGVLKSQQIKFSPPLPRWKEQAIQRLGFGLLNKLVLVFDTIFWDPAVELFGYAGSGKSGTSIEKLDLKTYRSSRGKFYMFWNCSHVTDRPILVTLMAGQSAYDSELMSKGELVKEAVETLQLIFPQINPIPTPVETIVTRWSEDEYAQGSYSYVAREATGEDYDLLAKPVDGQLYFAGEATSRQYPATAHGAYLSGLKVAKDILDSLIGPQVVNSGPNLDVKAHRMNNHSDSSSSSKNNTDYDNRVGYDLERRGRSSTTRHSCDNGIRSNSSSSSISSVGSISSSNSSASGRSSRSRSRSRSPRSHLLTMDDAYTSNSPSPSPHSETILTLKSLGHGFMIPRRKGRISRSFIAKFVSERSDDDESEDGV